MQTLAYGGYCAHINLRKLENTTMSWKSTHTRFHGMKSEIRESNDEPGVNVGLYTDPWTYDTLFRPKSFPSISLVLISVHSRLSRFCQLHAAHISEYPRNPRSRTKIVRRCTVLSSILDRFESLGTCVAKY